MSYSELLSSMISGGKANVRQIWQTIKDNFADHQSRINELESLASLIPVGGIVGYGSATVPPGFLACDGAEVERAAYSALFAAIGTSFGAGDGVNTFRLPEMRGRVGMGAGQGTLLTNRVLGNLWGEEEVTLTTDTIAAHSHSVTDPGHAHDWPQMNSGVGNGQPQTLGSSDDRQTANAATGISVVNAGSGNAHNNMQPFTVAAYIIRY